jgi:gamma-glutamylputrescine oxidase
MGSTSFWQADLADTVPGAAITQPLEAAITVDVAIVGAGITGTATALGLARAGVRVALVEARAIAAGASGRNGGFLLSGTSETYGEAVARFGRERARRVWGFSVANHEAAAALVTALEDAGWPTGYVRHGSLRLAASEAELAEIERGLALLREDGWQAEPVERAALPERLRTAYLGGLFYPTDGEIQPARFVTGLAWLAARASARIYTASPVVSVREDGDGILVTTPQGSVRAGQLLIATNAWAPELARQLGAGWLSSVILPTRGQMLATEPLPERLISCPCYADEGYQYWRQYADGRLVVGGWRNRSFATENTLDETPGDSVQRHLEHFVRQTLGLPEAAIAHRWAGIMAFSADGLPLVGRLPGSHRCYIAAGYTGHGNAYALRAASIVQSLILNQPHPDADLFDPARFASAGATRE